MVNAIIGVKKYFTVVVMIFAYFQLPAQNVLQYVQPLSGTAASTTPAAQKHSEAGSEKNANTIPAVTLPFAMTQFTPQTRLTETKCIPPYFYKDSLFSGIRATHWISGSCTQDYGSFTVMPVVGNLKTAFKDYALPFSHEEETTSPALYKLLLPDKNLLVEVTATLRCAVMRFTLLKEDSLYLLINPNTDFATCSAKVNRVTNEITATNTVHRIYQGWGNTAGFDGCIYIKPDKHINASGSFFLDNILAADTIYNKKEAGVYIGFYLKKGEALELNIGTSFSSTDAAKNNCEKEVGEKNFERVSAIAKQVWENALQQVQVKTKSEKDKKIFYTAMYHAMQHPRLMSDVDGSYPQFSGNDEFKKMQSGNYYDDFSMWDIYRAQLPLQEILNPDLTNQFVRSLIAKGQQGGWLPIFPCWNNYTAAMIGDHATAFIASAYNKGIRNFDVRAAYQLMRKNAFDSPADFADYKNGMGRRALSSYLKYGFIPMEDSVPEAFHKKEQVSRTLEYAFDDYALSVVAMGLNKKEDYQKLYKRSQNYKNVFDTAVKMFRGRYSTGKWFLPFNADKRATYITEGTPRQYSFYVPQDVAGLSKLMGGTRQLEKALDSLFIKNEYWHGNEPGHQVPFMYNYTKAPYKTQKAVHDILHEEYDDGAGGLSGNDDAGQMSAWYVFAAMGFYPVNPVSAEYALTSPLFDKIVIHFAGSKFFEIAVHKKSADAFYIAGVLWNGKAYNSNFITHAMIINGGKLEIYLQQKPASRGAAKNARPL